MEVRACCHSHGMEQVDQLRRECHVPNLRSKSLLCRILGSSMSQFGVKSSALEFGPKHEYSLRSFSKILLVSMEAWVNLDLNY